MPWYVLHTKPRNEKKVTRLLEQKGVRVYCPLRESIRQWSDRKKKVAEPVFKSYVFVYMDDYKEENVKVLMTAGTVRFLWWVGKPGVVREEEIQAIKDFLENYKNQMIQLDPKKTILVICHKDNTVDKHELREGHLSDPRIMKQKMRESKYQLKDFIKEPMILNFYKNGL